MPLAARRVALLALLMLCAGCGRPVRAAGSSGHGRSSTRVPVAGEPGPAGLHFGRPVAIAGGSALVALSCGSATSCVAIDASGRAYRFDGSGWTGPTIIGDVEAGPGSPSVSCAGPSACLADPAGGDQVWTWGGQGWSGPATLPAAGIEALGCAPSGYCAAVDALGNAFALDGGGWTGTAGDWGSVSSISCVAASFCMSASGGVSQWTGQRWSFPATLGAGSSFTGVSCPATSFCMAVTADGEAVQWDGAAWSEPVPVAVGRPEVPFGGQLEGVSCPTAAFCVAVDSRGQALVWRAGRWTAVDVDGARPLSAVSCPTATACVLVDRSGDAVVATAAPLLRRERSR